MKEHIPYILLGSIIGMLAVILMHVCCAEPVCKLVANPITGQYEQVCIDSSEAREPSCKVVANPLTGQYEYVCT